MSGSVVSIAQAANTANNAAYQPLRLERWTSVRDALWEIVDGLTHDGVHVAVIGAGSGDDVPLQRLAKRSAQIDLFDFDVEATRRAVARVAVEDRNRVRVIEHDVTGGAADSILLALRDDDELPDALPTRFDVLGDGDYDVVIGDMLYTQLLHAGLLALNIVGDRQLELMRRYDPPLTNALVQRIQSSLAPGGHAIHVHDLACWDSSHTQPLSLETVLTDPSGQWKQLRRHDSCDPHLVLERRGIRVRHTAWWEWPFEPNKRFLVRASVTRR